MQEKRASVKDIAAKLHISLSTVHKALTGKPGVSEERREQVRNVAEELGYVVNTAAQSLARKSINLGIIMPSKWQEFFAEMKEGMEQEIFELSEYKVNGAFFYISEKSDAESILNLIQENDIDAILACSSNHALSNLVSYVSESTKLPTFWVGGGFDNPHSVCDITIDAPLSGKLAADFISSAVHGKIYAAVFTGSLKTGVHRLKTEAFCERISSYGGEVAAICETEDNEEAAYRAIRDLIGEYPQLNSIYISTSTSGSICRYIEENALHSKIILIGTDVFDSLREYMKRGVLRATIYQNQQKVGKAAVRFAYDYLNMKNSYGSCDFEPEKKILISPALLLRANIE